MTAFAPLSRFGDVAIEPFVMTGETPADWTSEPRLVRLPVEGGNRTIYQFWGHEPYTVEWRLRLATTADFARLATLAGTPAKLRVSADATAHRGRYVQIHGEGYVEFDDVVLARIAEVRRRRDGTVTCTATFERAWVEG